jgi:predicted nucleic acid-binding Zn ribbon protein
MSWSRSPRPIDAALRAARTRVEPRTPLAAAQSAWPDAVGPGIAAQARPVAARDGVLTVACDSATWAQELDLMQDEVLGRLNETLSEKGPGEGATGFRALRFTADAARHFYS